MLLALLYFIRHFFVFGGKCQKKLIRRLIVWNIRCLDDTIPVIVKIKPSLFDVIPNRFECRVNKLAYFDAVCSCPIRS